MSPAFMYLVVSAVAVSVIVSAVYLIRALMRLHVLMGSLQGTAEYLEASRPKIDRILDSLEAELVELRGLSERVNHIVADAERVTTDVRRAVQPIVAEVSDLAGTLRHVRAVAAAVHAGISTWRDRRHESGEPTPENTELAEGS